MAQRLRAWLDGYGAEEACAAWLLCDRHDPAATAVIEVTPELHTRRLSFAELREASERRAAALADLGVTAGTPVATHMERGRELTVTSLAIWRLGGIAVPLFTMLAPGALAQRLSDSATRLVVTDPEHAVQPRRAAEAADGPGWRVVTTAELDAAAPAGTPEPAAVGGDAPLVLLYASSPTGRPRGIRVPLRALAAFHSYLHYGLDVADSDVYWNATDPSWSYGLYYGLLAPLAAGRASLQLRGGFDPELTLDVIATLGVTNFAAAPAVYRALRASIKTLPPEVLPRRLSTAGEPLGEDVGSWAYDVFGTPLREHYGQPELGACAGEPHHPDAAVAHRPGACGPAMPGWRLAVLDPIDDTELKPGEPGRVAVDTDPKSSPLLWFTGYHGRPAGPSDRLSPDGRWLLTGDAASVDEDGYLHFSSRDHDVILTGGYRVTPIEVENALVAHPGVAEAAVFGEPDPIAGETVAAEVVLAAEGSGGDALAEELRAFVRERLAAHAYPRTVRFVARLPRSASGKIQRGRHRGHH